jgi:hypothetical protein
MPSIVAGTLLKFHEALKKRKYRNASWPRGSFQRCTHLTANLTLMCSGERRRYWCF